MGNKKALYWVPRVLAVVLAAFISLFAFDVFGEDYTLSEKIVAFAIHLLPTFLLIAILIIAWKWERIGGLIYLALGIFYLLMMIGEDIPLIAYLAIPGWVLLTSALFLINGLKSRKQSSKERGENMNIGKIVIGLILIAGAVWSFMTIESTTVKYLVGIILAILGLVVLMMGFKKKETGPKPPEQPQQPQEPQQPQQPEQQ